jgi:cyanophycinase-like exopeptidase
MARLLVVMGSGETSPTMIKLHRSLFTRIGDGPAALLDTPYGFQENADDISAKAVAYFDASVGRTVDVVSWRRLDAPPAARERALSGLRAASWIFAGPGSPTYALRHWLDTPIPGLLADRLLTGGAVVFASAAALTLGSHTVPVYEIYKAGYEPQWRPGLDLIRETTGLPAVVVPHYDNAEGGHHDTRFCYLGERRLERMERDLPDEAFILGVDEHTAVVLDLDARTATVAGNGAMTIRRHGESTVHASGTELPFDTLATAPSTAPATGTARATGTTPTGTPPTTGTASGTAAAHGEGTPAYATALGSVPPVELPLRRDSPVRIETVRLATAFEAAGPTDVDGRSSGPGGPDNGGK